MIWTAPRTALNGSDLFVDREQLAPFNAVARRRGAGLFPACSTGAIPLTIACTSCDMEPAAPVFENTGIRVSERLGYRALRPRSGSHVGFFSVLA